MSADEVPVIDLSAFLKEWEAIPADRRATTKVDELPQEARTVVRAWREAFGKFGFCHAIGHGVPDEVIENTYACARKFFGLPLEEKILSDTGRPYGSAGGGFKAQGAESVSKTETANPGGQVAGTKTARPSDRVESMTYFGNGDDVIPKAVPEYADVMERYRKEVFRLLLGSMALTAAALDLPLGHFEPFFPTGKLSTNGNVMRLAYYPAYKEGQEPLPGQMRYGEHTDYTGFTFLWQDHNVSGPQTASSGLEAPPGGLQVRMPDGSYVDCPPKPKAFTINAGDLIQAWTNDVFLSNYHRVANPPLGDRHARISIVYFTGPTHDTMVEPLPTCVGPDRPARYSAISAGEHLNKKLKVSNV